MRTRAAWGYGATVARLTPDQKVGSSNLPALRFLYANEKHIACLQRARGVVVSHPLSMREALGSILSVSILPLQENISRSKIAERGFDPRTFGL